MDDSDGDLVYTYTLSLLSGVEYGYNFNDGGYESGSGLGDCAGGNYGNDYGSGGNNRDKESADELAQARLPLRDRAFGECFIFACEFKIK